MEMLLYYIIVILEEIANSYGTEQGHDSWLAPPFFLCGLEVIL